MLSRRSRRSSSLLALLFVALARAAADSWAGQPLAAMLEALRHQGLEIAYSNELVPADLRVDSIPTGRNLRERTEAALAAHQLRLRLVATNRYVVDRRPADSTAADAAGATLPAPPSMSPAPLDEVLVYADRDATDIRARSAQRQQVAHVPGASEDALGVLRTMPGIAADTSARPYVRGSSQEDVLVIFDHVPIPDPFHLKNFGNLAGVFDVSVIDRIDLYSGGFPVRYGTRSGGVVELTPHSYGTTPGHELTLGAGLSALRGTSAGHTDSGLEWLTAVRHSLGSSDALSAGERLDQPLTVDGLARVRWQRSAARSWTAGMLALDDRLHLQNSAGTERVNASSRSQNLWLTTETDANSGWQSRTTLIGSHTQSRRSGDTVRPNLLSGTLDDQRDLNGLSLQHDSLFTRPGGARWDVGGEFASSSGSATYLRHMHYDPQAVQELSLDPLPDADVDASLRSISYAAFASYAYSLGARLHYELGLRYDVQHYPELNPFEEWSPRLDLRVQASKAIILRGSVGKYTQAQRPDERRFEESQYTPDHPQVNVQESLGVDFHLASGPLWRAEVYHKHWDRISPYFDNLLNERGLLPELAPLRVRVAPRSAVAQGFELSVRSAAHGPLQYWTSYTSALVQDRIGQSTVSRSWDQRSALSSGADLSHRAFSGTAVLRWHSGTPSTSVSMTPGANGSDPHLQVAARNSGRTGDFISLDLRAAWIHSMGYSDLELWTEITNSLNRGSNCCALPAGSGSVGSGLDAGGGSPRSINLGLLWRFR